MSRGFRVNMSVPEIGKTLDQLSVYDGKARLRSGPVVTSVADRQQDAPIILTQVNSRPKFRLRAMLHCNHTQWAALSDHNQYSRDGRQADDDPRESARSAVRACIKSIEHEDGHEARQRGPVFQPCCRR